MLAAEPCYPVLVYRAIPIDTIWSDTSESLCLLDRLTSSHAPHAGSGRFPDPHDQQDSFKHGYAKASQIVPYKPLQRQPAESMSVDEVPPPEGRMRAGTMAAEGQLQRLWGVIVQVVLLSMAHTFERMTITRVPKFHMLCNATVHACLPHRPKPT